jgi:hypothetical protein
VSIPPTIRPYRAAASKTPPGWRLAAASLTAAFCSSSNEAPPSRNCGCRTVMRARDLRGMTEDRWLV